MGKNLDIEKFLKNVALAVRKGVYSHGYAMLGFPTETAAEMEQTIAVACRSRLHTLSCFTVTPFPNTELYRLAQKTHGPAMERIQYNDGGYVTGRINLSSVPDETLFAYQRLAHRRFFMNPERLWRIFWDHPRPHLLPLYIPLLLQRTTAGLRLKSKATAPRKSENDACSS
jgi:anaerobic magnesium-protoporphyrin IX monomethyl ester cyclase